MEERGDLGEGEVLEGEVVFEEEEEVDEGVQVEVHEVVVHPREEDVGDLGSYYQPEEEGDQEVQGEQVAEEEVEQVGEQGVLVAEEAHFHYQQGVVHNGSSIDR